MTVAPAGRIEVEDDAAGEVVLAAGLVDAFVAEADVLTAEVDDEGGRLVL